MFVIEAIEFDDGSTISSESIDELPSTHSDHMKQIQVLS